MKTRWKERIKQKYNHLATRDLPFFFFFWLFFPLASSFVVRGFENVRFYLYEQVNQSYLSDRQSTHIEDFASTEEELVNIGSMSTNTWLKSHERIVHKF